MEFAAYAKFLPETFRAEPLIEPTSTWWSWRGRTVHVARAVDGSAPVRALGIHGGGGYSGALWPFAALAARAGVEVMVPDMPLYGDTIEPHPNAVRYGDWIDLLCDLVEAEHNRDARPIVLFGASLGGMMAYEVAARTGLIGHVVATCLLDPADVAARRAMARFSATGAMSPTLLRGANPLIGRVRVPIRWLADMDNMSLDPALSRLCANDPKGGGVRVPIGFLESYLNYEHTRPETFAAAKVTLTHPAADRWTPPEISIRFLERIAGPTELQLLDNCGHYPIEEPGLSQLAATLRAVLAEFTDPADDRPRV